MNSRRVWLAAATLLVVSYACRMSSAFPRYKNDAQDEGSNCSQCHGDFKSNVSPKGTTFPADSKHEMHRGANSMNANCNLCHTTGDGHNPLTYSSNGTVNNTGLGCTGCHVAEGLRAHHAANGIWICAVCHPSNGPPPPENVKPPYYGSVDTRVDNPCNGVPVEGTNENWSVGDFLGIDNDGDNLYDMADFSCGPYRIVEIREIGNDLLVSWETAGGRRDVVRGAPTVEGAYTNVSPVVSIPGTGVVVTNHLIVGGATQSTRFYRIWFVP